MVSAQNKSAKGSPVAVVTGGASGLGYAIVERLLKHDVDVAIVDVNAPDDIAQVERNDGVRCRYFQCDVTDRNATVEIANRIFDMFGRIDYLVNAAGIIRRMPSAEMDVSSIQAVIQVNLIGTAFMCQAVFPHMVKSGGGSIVNFGSMLAHYGSKNLLSYAMSKGGVIQLTKTLAVEWAEWQIRVNAVSPGYIETNLSSGATKDPIFKERILSRTPQRRFGTPQEVAAAVCFLLSDEASFITGVDLPVDGGILAGDPSLFPPASIT